MKFGLIGFPVIHSFSKKYFTEKFENEGIDAVYDLFPLEKIELFDDLIANHSFTGLNVTIPHKQAVIPYLDELDATAAEIGAVNVIQFIRHDDGLKLKGYNTDAIGFENSIKPWLKPHHRNALILGTGGASKAIDYALRKNGITTTFVSRTGNANRLAYDDLTNELMQHHTIIVNCTPLGMDPAIDGFPAIPYSATGPSHLFYDVVYKPEETVFLRKGKEQGATTINGLEMLWGQAEAAWKIWNQF